MSAILKQKLIDIANGFTKYGLWKGGGSSGSSALSDMTDVSFSNLKENDLLKYKGGVWVNSDNIHEYSTEEKIVGKWIDGRNIYEITYYNQNPNKSSFYNEYISSNLILNADIFIEISGTVKREIVGGLIYPISYEDNNYKFHVRPQKTDNGYIINYCCFFSGENISNMIITLKYVKNE